MAVLVVLLSARTSWPPDKEASGRYQLLKEAVAGWPVLTLAPAFEELLQPHQIEHNQARSKGSKHERAKTAT
jgi:hypothetical protein